ncbi:PREDICTED: transcription factor bHLH25-like isoform X2 [Ipomoea nil]|uniref:transcription factor bHLH25-like isoform X2 n=1 Tax=Ipomoea nil TaxID=35883 RepID=UPI000900D643|nr:PREDICTED: transcription factor bHLH25-like isoform X2 [Ipomoea nil]
MDVSPGSCFSEQDFDDLIFNGEDEIMNTIEELAAALGEDLPNASSTSSESVDSALTGKRSPSPNVVETQERVPKQRKLHHGVVHGKPDHTTADLSPSSSTPFILSFGYPNNCFPQKGEDIILETLKPEIPATVDAARKKINSSGRASKLPSNTYDHIMAERKRRQLLSQQFQDLSTIVPGLKKMDKTSVLGDTIKYLRNLQERVKNLEEQASKQTIKSNVYVRRSQLLIEDEGSSYEDSGSGEQSLPEIETRVSDRNILLRIYCEKHRGVLTNIFTEVDKFNLSVTNTSVSHFGSLALDITIIAEMEKEKDLSVKDLVKGIRTSLQHATRASKKSK